MSESTRTLALDVSTHTGYAVLDSEGGERAGAPATTITLVTSGKLDLPRPGDFGDTYPWNYMHAAKAAAEKLVELVVQMGPDVIVVEETNLGKQRYSQKLLEFLHYALMNLIGEKTTAGAVSAPVFYLTSSEWRSHLGMKMTKGDKKNNQRRKLAMERHTAYMATFVPSVNAQGKTSKPKSLHSFKKDLGVSGKVDWKDLSVRFANEKYGKNFEKVDNDESDAICLATAFATGARPAMKT